MRHDVLGESQSRPKSIAFGTLSAHPIISAWLSQSPDARHRWAEVIGADPLEGDLLAKLLLSHTLEQEGVIASLYSTTQLRRLAVPAAVMQSPAPPDQVDAFARCLAAVRDALTSRSAR
jgi:hypothetical protein